MMASAVVDPTGVPVGGRGCLCRVDNGQGVARGCLPRCFPGLKCSYVVLSGVKWPWGTLSGTYVALACRPHAANTWQKFSMSYFLHVFLRV